MNAQTEIRQAEEDQNDTRHANYDLFILSLTIISLFLLLVLILPFVREETKEIAIFMDTIISLIFMADFFRSLAKAPSKRAYLKWGWMDFLGSLPAYPAFRVFRIWRLVRAVRILRRTSVRHLWSVIRQRPSESTLLITVLASLVLLGFASWAVLIAEGDEPNGNISSASDAIWWSLVSVTTVGYGDRFPVSLAGRLVAILIMTAGITLAGVITSYLSTVFVGQEDKNAGQKEEIARLRSELAEMRGMLETLVEREP